MDLTNLLVANKYFENKDFLKAQPLYKEALESKAKDILCVLKKYAICLKENLLYNEAIEYGKKYLEIVPCDIDVLLNTCISYGKIGQYDQALGYYKRILRINNKYTFQIGYYAYLLGKTGNIVEADENYKKAIENDPQNVWYISHYALFLEETNKYHIAKKYYEVALEMEPHNTWIIKRYAICLTKIGGKIAGYSYYTTLIEKDSLNWNYYVNYAELAILSEDASLMLNILNKSKTLNYSSIAKIIFSFYWCVYFIYLKKQNELDEEIEKLIAYRADYHGFLHRDLIDLEAYVNSKMDASQKNNFQYIREVLRNGVKKNEAD